MANGLAERPLQNTDNRIHEIALHMISMFQNILAFGNRLTTTCSSIATRKAKRVRQRKANVVRPGKQHEYDSEQTSVVQLSPEYCLS